MAERTITVRDLTCDNRGGGGFRAREKEYVQAHESFSSGSSVSCLRSSPFTPQIGK